MNKKLLLVILAVIILVLVGGGYYYWKIKIQNRIRNKQRKISKKRQLIFRRISEAASRRMYRRLPLICLTQMRILTLTPIHFQILKLIHFNKKYEKNILGISILVLGILISGAIISLADAQTGLKLQPQEQKCPAIYNIRFRNWATARVKAIARHFATTQKIPMLVWLRGKNAI